MPTVGEQLRAAREALQLSVAEVAEVTKIKADHIRALEAGEYDRFVAPVYVRGFVRTYARLLKLDERQLAAQLDAELQATQRLREPPPLMPRPQTALDYLMLKVSRLNWRVVGAVVLLLAVVGMILAGFKGRNAPTSDPFKGLGPGLYQSPATAGGELLPLPPVQSNRP
jgi:cytoskeleton protein RodZ